MNICKTQEFGWHISLSLAHVAMKRISKMIISAAGFIRAELSSERRK